MGAPGVISIKTMQYRGNDEEWSNKYRFVGDAPSSESDWRDLCDAQLVLESPALIDTLNITRFLCYEDVDDDSVYTYDLSHFDGVVPGGFSHPSSDECPGDSAIWTRYATSRRTSAGKPIYLRNYYHGVVNSAAGEPDTFYATQRALFQTFASGMVAASGDWPGLADLDGSAVPGGYLTSTFITTRTLKRRGRRPS